MTLGVALIRLLEAYGVEVVFGIPGVHTIELYRGLAASTIRHVTPRHEQGAGFMADGYARASGKPGVALVITGPGLTNTLTAMAQARADSIPMLVVSGVNQTAVLGRGLGHLHELPDQLGLARTVALKSTRVVDGPGLAAAMHEAFSIFTTARPGPVHIEIPLDAMAKPAGGIDLGGALMPTPPQAEAGAIEAAAGLLREARRPLILAGGGACRAEGALLALAERLGAPVVTTINARGLLHAHPLGVPASPSLPAVRGLMADADAVLAVGTEFGQTDYDMYANGGFVVPERLVRIDIDASQLARYPATVPILADAGGALAALAAALGNGPAASGGAARAAATRQAARGEIEPYMVPQLAAVEAIRDSIPGAVIVGDSTQPIYAANLYYDHDRPGGWFNAATGYGTLGYALPAAIGAAVALPDTPVVCLAGDGGLQFTLPELGALAELALPVVVVLWNNAGYREIEAAMRGADISPVGVTPVPPDFSAIAAAYRIGFERVMDVAVLGEAVRRARTGGRPAMVEIRVD